MEKAREKYEGCIVFSATPTEENLSEIDNMLPEVDPERVILSIDIPQNLKELMWTAFNLIEIHIGILKKCNDGIQNCSYCIALETNIDAIKDEIGETIGEIKRLQFPSEFQSGDYRLLIEKGFKLSLVKADKPSIEFIIYCS